MSIPRGVYVVRNGGVVISTAITIIQIVAGAANPIEILRATLTQGASAASAQTQIQLLRKAGAATVTSATPLLLRGSDPASSAVGGAALTGITASAEGTNGDILVDQGFNVLTGWQYLPVPEERIWVPAAGIIAMTFPVAPASQTWRAEIVFQEF